MGALSSERTHPAQRARGGGLALGLVPPDLYAAALNGLLIFAVNFAGISRKSGASRRR